MVETKTLEKEIDALYIELYQLPNYTKADSQARHRINFIDDRIIELQNKYQGITGRRYVYQHRMM